MTYLVKHGSVGPYSPERTPILMHRKAESREEHASPTLGYPRGSVVENQSRIILKTLVKNPKEKSLTSPSID